VARWWKRIKAYGVRSYMPEKNRRGSGIGRARRGAEQQAVYATGRRSAGRVRQELPAGGAAELVERSFAIVTKRAGCGAAILRGPRNISKFDSGKLITWAGFNLA